MKKINNIPVKNLWGVGDFLAQTIYDHLVAFDKMKKYGYPYNMSEKEWKEARKDMILGFKMHLKRDDEFYKILKKHQKTATGEEYKCEFTGRKKRKMKRKELKAYIKETNDYDKLCKEKMSLFIKYIDNLWD